ncbi:MAG: UvrD-helicase domain-containing protein [Acidimicrobiia bacterium]
MSAPDPTLFDPPVDDPVDDPIDTTVTENVAAPAEPEGPAPIDAGARARVRDDHAASLFIEAGAGTGKTTALVDRVVALVASGAVELREVAAITFTEAAASELRDRIRARLEAAAAGGVDWVESEPGRARCRAALGEIDDAALTTLHGFAQRLLSEYPLEAGLPPAFEVLDDIRARVRFEQKWSELVERLFADPGLEAVLLTGLVLGLRFDHLRAAARLLHDNHDRVEPPEPVPPIPPLDIDPLLAALDDVVVQRAGGCRFNEDNLAIHIDKVVVPYRQLLRDVDDRLDLLECVADAPKLTCSTGKKDNWSTDITRTRDACKVAQERLAAILDGQRRAVLGALMHHVVEFVRTDAQNRRREGTLEFHDLLVGARDLLRGDRGVRDAAAQRWRRILLDEFQDTDPLQIQLAVLLATTDTEAGTLDWREVTIEAGALAVVGDPKQSIYRFRRADLRVYDDARTRLALDEATLVENFRSVPQIIECVNAVFSGLLGDGDAGIQASHVDLHAHRASLPGRSAVSTFGDASEDKVAEIRAREAEDVAAIVQQIKRDEWKVGRHDGTGALGIGIGSAEYADIAILIPSRTVLPGIEDALERAGIPARVESQSLLFATAEIRDLLSILTAIDDPSDDIAIVAALRATAFGCSDGELAEYAMAGGRWDYRVAAGTPPAGIDDGHPVVAGLRSLRDLWDQRWWRTVSQTVEAVVRERRLLELAVARRRPRDHWRRIRYILDQARAWDDAGRGTLRSFIEWAHEQAEERARVSESVAPEPDDDAVRILTVHGAKGLEFPVVLLAGLSTQPPNFQPAVVWDAEGRAEYRVGTRSTRTETLGYDAALKDEGRHEQAERIRLLYVAMTRARDHLVVSLHRKEGAKSHATSVAEHLTSTDAVVIEPGTPVPAEARPASGAPAAEPAAFAAWTAERTAALARATVPSSIAATTIAKGDDRAGAADPGLEKEPPPEQAPPWRRGRAGTAIGRAVHAVLQTIDLATGADLDETARAQANAEGVADRADEVRALAESARVAPVVRAAVDGGHRWWREVPVAAEVGGLVLEGFIDLLVETDDGLVVVDYKTDHLSDDDIEVALARYSIQGAAYAVALEAALDRPVTRCVFVFAGAPAARERDVTDLDAAKSEVRSRIRSLTT